MSLEHEQHVNPVSSLAHVEGLSPVSERVVKRKKDHRQNRRQRSRPKEEQERAEKDDSNDKDRHIDFCA